MRIILNPAAAIVALVLTTTFAAAQQQTVYCLVEGGDARAYNCSYRTMEQCLASRSGGGQTCAPYTLQR